MNEPIRILHVNINMNRGGAETLIMNVYRNIDRSKVQFDFLVHTKDKSHFDDEIISMGGNIFSVSNPAYKKLPTIGSLNYYKQQLYDFFNVHKNYKIVHTHMSGRSSDILKVTKNLKVPIRIAHSHIALNQKNVKRVFYELKGFSVKYHATHMFACSEVAGVSLFGKKRVREGQVKIVRNAIDINTFTYNENKREVARKKLGVGNKLVVGNVGRFSFQKNHKFLVEIFKEVHKKNQNTILLLIGDGDLRSSIEKQLNDFKLAENVLFTGIRSDIPDLLQAMDVFVFPSRYEGLGIVAVEAQAAGLPTIVAETIPKEAYVTSLIEKVSLKASADKWADRVLKYTDGYNRTDTSDQIKSRGYDIAETAKWLEDFYIKE